MIMNKKIKTTIYYLFIILLVLFANYIIMLFKFNDKNNVINNIMAEENASLKAEISELSNIDYHNYDYVIGKITIKNLYQSNTYFIDVSGYANNNSPVINNIGLIGLYNNHFLIPSNTLNLSIKINNTYGTLKDNKVTISHGQYEIGDKIYSSGLTNIPENILIGEVQNIYPSTNTIEDTIDIKYIENNTTYVGILTNYA